MDEYDSCSCGRPYLFATNVLLARDAHCACELGRRKVVQHDLSDVSLTRVLVAARDVRVGEAEPPTASALEVEAVPATLPEVHLVHVRGVLVQSRDVCNSESFTTANARMSTAASTTIESQYGDKRRKSTWHANTATSTRSQPLTYHQQGMVDTRQYLPADP